MWNTSQENPNQVCIKQPLHMLKEHNTKLRLKLETVQFFSVNAQVIVLHLRVSSAVFCFPTTLQYLKYFLKIQKVGKLHSCVSVSNIYMFLQKWGEDPGMYI